MSTTQTIRRQVPLRHAKLTGPMQFWEMETQQAHPMQEIDTSKGAETMSPPAAGLDSSTGQTNQNQEITYIKTSADTNVFTLQGANLPGGPYTLTAQYQTFKIKSNGAVWYKSA
jgi:hypothetical protein